MKWYFKVGASHTRVRVFMNGAKCGDLCFRNEEFEHLRAKDYDMAKVANFIEFIDETPAPVPPDIRDGYLYNPPDYQPGDECNCWQKWQDRVSAGHAIDGHPCETCHETRRKLPKEANA